MISKVGKWGFFLKKKKTQLVYTDLVKLNPEFSSAFQRRGEGVEILTPESKEFLYA